MSKIEMRAAFDGRIAEGADTFDALEAYLAAGAHHKGGNTAFPVDILARDIDLVLDEGLARLVADTISARGKVYVNVYWASQTHGAERLPDRLAFELHLDDGEQYFFEWCDWSDR